jgi:hypothetical protein
LENKEEELRPRRELETILVEDSFKAKRKEEINNLIFLIKRNKAGPN